MESNLKVIIFGDDIEISNSRMKRLLDENSIARVTLNSRLAEIVNQGFLIEKGCYLLVYFKQLSQHLKETDFVDQTGFECFVNSFHVDDFVQEDLLPQAMAFSKALLAKWKRLRSKEVLEIIVGETDFGFNIKAHVKRNGELWIDPQDIENFDEGLLLVSSNQEIL